MKPILDALNAAITTDAWGDYVALLDRLIARHGRGPVARWQNEAYALLRRDGLTGDADPCSSS